MVIRPDRRECTVQPPEDDIPSVLLLRDGAIPLSLDLRVYRLAAVQKTAYRLADRCTAVLGPIREETLSVILTFSPGATEAAAVAVGRLFFQELLDQELREKIGEETHAIRSLILAQAFSKTDLISRE